MSAGVSTTGDFIPRPVRAAFRRLLGTEISGVGLALFRIAYATTLLGEVLRLRTYQHLIFDPIPFVRSYGHSYEPMLIGWILCLVCLLIGFETRAAAVANYVAGLGMLSVSGAFEYHVDYVYTGINFLLILSPVSNCLSVDAMVAARKQPGQRPARVALLYHHLFVFVGLALVYFDSVFWKLASEMWRAGLAIWLPASFPAATYLDLSPVLDQRAFVIAASYATLAFEAAFPLLMWLQRARLALFITGVALHLGILGAFPIPFFSATMLSLYLLLLPLDWYERLDRRFVGSPLPTASQSRRPRTGRMALAALAPVFLVLQLAAIVNGPALRQRTPRHLSQIASAVTRFSQPALGLTSHTVFLDGHFQGYEHIVAVVHLASDGREQWLPIIDERGQVGDYTWGRVWVNWTFRVMGPAVNPNQLARGIERYTAFWAGQRGLPLDDLTFRVLAKRVEAPFEWQPGLLERNLRSPWLDAGRATWRRGTFAADIVDIEALGLDRPRPLR